MTVNVPSELFIPLDPSRTIAIPEPHGGKYQITLSSSPIHSPVILSAVAWVIDSERVLALGRFETSPQTASSEQSQPVPPTADMTSVKSAMLDRLGELFNKQAPAQGTWVAVSKLYFQTQLNALFAGGKPCLSAHTSLPYTEFNKVIDFPDETTIDCTPSRECSNEHIDCTPKRNCSNDHISCP